MASNVEMFMIVGKKYLEEYFNSSFMQFENCCGVCWCCFKRKSILDEFEKKGFKTFNSSVKGWKLINNLINLKFIRLTLLRLLIRKSL